MGFGAKKATGLEGTENITALFPVGESSAFAGTEKIKQKIDPEFLKKTHRHHMFDNIARRAKLRHPILLVGPTGSGKTTIAAQIAAELKLPFKITGSFDSEYKMTGWTAANGQDVMTQFRDAYENGGVFLMDEMDGSHPQALVALHAAMDGEFAEFNGETIKRHPDFVLIATANTYGHGATHDYVGRYQLDDATRNRFSVITMEYDEEMEEKITKEKYGEVGMFWLEIVRLLRHKAWDQKKRINISPRATFRGAEALMAGCSLQDVLDEDVWKGFPKEEVIQILKASEDEADQIYRKYHRVEAIRKILGNVWQDLFGKKKEGVQPTQPALDKAA